MKLDNPYFYLASSQLFPAFTQEDALTVNNSLISQLKQAQALVLGSEHNKALDIYDSLIVEYPNQPFLYACRSILKTLIEEDEGAFYDYQIAKRLDFNYHNLIEWINNEGQMLESDELLELVNQENLDEQLYINRATLFVQHFEYEKAILDFTKAYELGGNPKVLVSIAAVYMRLVRYDKALSNLNTAINIDSTFAQAFLIRAKLYVAIHEYELADNDFTKALALNVNDLSVYEERAQYYELTEQWTLAIADYSEMININPEDFYVYVLRADVYEKTGSLAEALADYSKAISLNPYYSDLYQYRGDIRKSLGDENGAEEDYAKFNELEED